MSHLTVQERDELAQLERQIEDCATGIRDALADIHEKRLYRHDYSSFEEYCRDRWGMTRAHAHNLLGWGEVSRNIEQMSTMVDTPLPEKERHARPLVSLDPEQQAEVWTEAVQTAPKKPDGSPNITARHVEETRDRIVKPHVANNSGDNEWYTPPEYIEAARAIMGGIDLDPASCAFANTIVQAETFFDEASNGLSDALPSPHEGRTIKRWWGRVWLNPPYGRGLVDEFVNCLVHNAECGYIEQACVLVNNATDTGWFRDLADHADAVCFLTGRISFLKEDGARNTPLQGQAILYFGSKVDEFCRVFDGEFGHTWRRG